MAKRSKEKSLYPSTLIHFTKKYSTLLKILDSSHFKVSHSTEDIHGMDIRSRKFAIPMVSFCDIRLSHLTEHTNKYGSFGLGLKKSWGIEKGLNPVFYVSKNCPMVDYLNNTLREFKESYLFDPINNQDHSTHKMQYNAFINPLRYMKNYEGTLKRKNRRPIPDYRYANENEWRYVPDIQSNVIPIRLEENKKKGDEELKIHCEAILPFSHDDIRYIFVKDESHLNRLVRTINRKYDDEKIRNILISKIFVTSNIFDDL
ncbi:Protein of uncharacterised function (DUF2743) [Yersinia enterocolitica]|uniref:abortive infection system antitoxin AbiGi family protein n=1 Tax=Yersinia enterocolitica TaxID=630 RepID=UPI0005EA270E|nr:abortive infection system antitoxin AbiGi family protein [Yersinia enterocolitica]CNH01084.1 Protein of uncharacterised function (DUF2743) [Yersinia enterocolitica]